jgi:phospholipase/carboxylesterase
MSDLKTYAYGPANGGKPKKVVLMLHGLGSNGQDLIGLAPLLAQTLPEVLFLSPDAPQDYDMAPPGFGYQWFSLKSFEHDFMLQGARAAEPGLNIYIDAVLGQTGLKDSDLALLGFSQGTMMSLFGASRRKSPVAGVLGYSGALLAPDELALPGMQKFPVCLIHGEADDVVTIDRYHAAKDALQNAGFDVEGHTIPGLPHSIDQSGISFGSAFLQKIFAGITM